MSNRIFLDYPSLSQIEQECQESLIQERFTFNEIGTKASNICKAKFYRVFPKRISSCKFHHKNSKVDFTAYFPKWILS